MARGEDLIGAARDEIVGMAKEGMAHPSTAPVLTGAAVGAVAGWILPIVSLPIFVRKPWRANRLCSLRRRNTHWRAAHL